MKIFDLIFDKVPNKRKEEQVRKSNYVLPENDGDFFYSKKCLELIDAIKNSGYFNEGTRCFE